VLHGARVVIGKFLSVVLIASVVGKRREFAILCNGKIQFMKKITLCAFVAGSVGDFVFPACFIVVFIISLDIMSRDNGHLVTDFDQPVFLIIT